MLEEMIFSYQRISSQINKDLFMCPSDYPYLYVDNNQTNILLAIKDIGEQWIKLFVLFLLL